MNEKIQKFGKSLLMPISTIAAAGIFLGLAAALQNPEIVGDSFVAIEGLQIFIGFIRKAAGLIFGNLPVLFALSIAIGLAKEEKGTAALSALIGFLIFHMTINYLLSNAGITAESVSIESLINSGMNQVEANMENARFDMVLGFFTYRMNVFGGVIVGLVVANLHNKFYKISLPDAFNFFGGTRFIPLVTIIVLPVVAVISYFVWPYVDKFISLIGLSIANTGVFGPFIHGAANRLLIPTGLHHILNQLVRFTPIGGQVMVDGELVEGALNIFNAAIASENPVPNEVFQVGARFVGQGHSLTAMFGLPAAALAMIKTAKPESKQRVKTMFFAAITASFLTGITEPIEFAFMFISPILFIFHAIVAGLGYMVLAILGTSVGGIQAGIIDFIIYGVLRGSQSGWYLVVIVGIFVALIYYYGFKYFIEKYNILTPGRGDTDDEEVYRNEEISVKENTLHIIEALGGKDNINDVANCMTRLRVNVKDMDLVNETKLMQTGANGIAKPSSETVHVVYGLKVDQISSEVQEYLK